MKHLINKSTEELKKTLAEKREEVRQFRFGTGIASRNTKAPKAARHEIARILTLLNTKNAK
jgi:ribosomal protein L29